MHFQKVRPPLGCPHQGCLMTPCFDLLWSPERSTSGTFSRAMSPVLCNADTQAGCPAVTQTAKIPRCLRHPAQTAIPHPPAPLHRVLRLLKHNPRSRYSPLPLPAVRGHRCPHSGRRAAQDRPQAPALPPSSGSVLFPAVSDRPCAAFPDLFGYRLVGAEHRLRLHDHARTAAVRVIVHAVEFIC